MATTPADCPTQAELAAALRALEKRLEHAQRAEEVSLREHLEYRDTVLQERVEQRMAAMDHALVLRTQAVEEHLIKLNGEQSRLAADRERFISHEKFEPTMTNIMTRMEQQAKEFDTKMVNLGQRMEQQAKEFDARVNSVIATAEEVRRQLAARGGQEAGLPWREEMRQQLAAWSGEGKGSKTTIDTGRQNIVVVIAALALIVALLTFGVTLLRSPQGANAGPRGAVSFRTGVVAQSVFSGP